MSTVRVQREQRFGTAIEDGFRLITDMETWPSFWPGLVRVESGSRWSAPGDRARLVMRFLGREVLLELTLRELAVDRVVRYDSVQAGLPDARHERQFQRLDDGFLYRIVVEYEPRPGIRGLLDRTVVRRGTARIVRQTLANLERLLGPPGDAGRKDHP
jgi:hypothetical protein